MARVRDIELNEAPKEISLIYKKFIESYGPFANQAKVFAHRPIIFKHMMSMLETLKIFKSNLITFILHTLMRIRKYLKECINP